MAVIRKPPRPIVTDFARSGRQILEAIERGNKREAREFFAAFCEQLNRRFTGIEASVFPQGTTAGVDQKTVYLNTDGTPNIEIPGTHVPNTARIADGEIIQDGNAINVDENNIAWLAGAIAAGGRPQRQCNGVCVRQFSNLTGTRYIEYETGGTVKVRCNDGTTSSRLFVSATPGFFTTNPSEPARIQNFGYTQELGRFRGFITTSPTLGSRPINLGYADFSYSPPENYDPGA